MGLVVMGGTTRPCLWRICQRRSEFGVDLLRGLFLHPGHHVTDTLAAIILHPRCSVFDGTGWDSLSFVVIGAVGGVTAPNA